MRSPRHSTDLDATSLPSSEKSNENVEERHPLTGAPSPSLPTRAMDTTSILTSSTPQLPGLPIISPPALTPNDLPNNIIAVPNDTVKAAPNAANAPDPKAAAAEAAKEKEAALPSRGPRTNPARSISTNRRFSGSTVNSDGAGSEPPKMIGKVGVCALDVKARSRPCRSILTRIQQEGEYEIIVFGDKAILDEDMENWPICDFLISFFSDGFPLDKAIAYVKLRKPFVVNDLSMQKVLWDRRLCLRILDKMGVPTPKRIEVNRDGGPRLESAELAAHMKAVNGVVLEGPEDGTGGGARTTLKVELSDDGDTLLVDGKPIKKPFVEKPVSGEDHNVIIYFPKDHEAEDGQRGGARRLFRKIGNKSSDYDPKLIIPRSITEENSSYVYEQFLRVENAEDVKAYTVGPDYCHAETRKSPVVDGLVRRNTHGKELRYITKLNKTEATMAARVANGFGQRICGFDMLRAGNGSFVIDVNGWSFVKDNNEYYDQCARILKDMFRKEKIKEEFAIDETADFDAAAPHRQSTAPVHAHRSALRTILKSPSMSKLSNHLPHSGRHSSSTTSASLPRTMTVPLSSPPSMERQAREKSMMREVINSPLEPVELLPSLPPPVITTTNMLTPTVLPSPERPESEAAPLPKSKHSWKLKGMVTVIRHADRTPKQKIKFTAHSQVFADLLVGHRDEVLLKDGALASVEAAVKIAMQEKLEDVDKLKILRNALAKKGGQPGTKVQIKPMFRKRKPEEMEATDILTPGATPLIEKIPENEPMQLSESPTLDKAPPASTGTEMHRVATRSDSISDATFSRFSAAEDDLVIDKMQLVMKWGGEPTHSARYQSQELGTNMREDLKLLNKEVLNNVRIFTSSEKRVKTSAQIWAASFLGLESIDESYISVRKDLLDDSNAAKDLMDKVKKKLKHLLREGNSAPEQFAWPKDMPEPSIVMTAVVELLKFHRRVMRHNFKKLSTTAIASLASVSDKSDSKSSASSASSKEQPLTATSVQSRWCTGEDADLFKERWEKLFTEFCDTEKADPGKVSELYDTMKYDALHNKQFLEWVFTPSQSVLDEIAKEEQMMSQNTSPEGERAEPEPTPGTNRHDSTVTLSSLGSERHSFAQKIGLRRKSVLNRPPITPPIVPSETASYFKLFSGNGESRSKSDKRLSRLRELYRYSKILFDYVGPQEYGISDDEKLEIGLLTSLPLLREIVQDLEELQHSGDAKSFVYFTKESHIYTLLNCIMEGGIRTKIKRSAIPELDYLSSITFELYEALDQETNSRTYSIRIAISPGCHTNDPLDVSLDSKHAIGSAPRRSLTDHQDYQEVIATLKAKFETVQLPKSFLAVNVSDKHETEKQYNAEDGPPMSSRALSESTNDGTTHEQVTVKPSEEVRGRPEEQARPSEPSNGTI
jgi:inositol hexakisphosphate/diphosphoinositol-pentakisphosphate kinase